MCDKGIHRNVVSSKQKYKHFYVNKYNNEYVNTLNIFLKNMPDSTVEITR